MAVLERTGIESLLADTESLERTMHRIYQELGIRHDPDATAERSRALILEDGIRPEDNAFSREIIRMRYPADEDGG